MIPWIKYIKFFQYVKAFTWRLKTYKILAIKTKLILIDFFQPHPLDFGGEEITPISMASSANQLDNSYLE
jgi:hypothetical protein